MKALVKIAGILMLAIMFLVACGESTIEPVESEPEEETETETDMQSNFLNNLIQKKPI